MLLRRCAVYTAICRLQCCNLKISHITLLGSQSNDHNGDGGCGGGSNGGGGGSNGGCCGGSGDNAANDDDYGDHLYIQL